MLVSLVKAVTPPPPPSAHVERNPDSVYLSVMENTRGKDETCSIYSFTCLSFYARTACHYLPCFTSTLLKMP